MLIDLTNDTSIAEQDADLCIVGGGPAGIAIAREFMGTGTRVVLIESGGAGNCQPDAERDLNRGELAGLPDFPLDIARYRGLGGASNLWAGACAPLNDIDFEQRPWVPHSGWPISRSDLDPYYERVHPLFDIGPYDYAPEQWEGGKIGFLPFAEGTAKTRLWQISPRTNFGQKYRAELEQSANVHVLLHGTVTELLTDADSARVRAVKVQTPGPAIEIRAKRFVLAAGGIENPRLLLLSRRARSGGIGNEYDVVGRYFMQHPHASSAKVEFLSKRRWVPSYKDFKRESLWLRAGLGVSEEAQRRESLLNYSAILIDLYIQDSVSQVQSLGYASFKRIIIPMSRGRIPPQMGYHMKRILGDLDGVLLGLTRRIFDGRGVLYTRSEQAPNPDSRVTLSNDTDRYGCPRARVDWRMLPIDKRSIRTSVQIIGAELERLGVARLVPEDWLMQDDETWPASIQGGYHHMGATRMSDDPKRGVVDRNCRVHSMQNLFVAGCSIFPTGGFANPTLTLTAAALRLSDHLKAEALEAAA